MPVIDSSSALARFDNDKDIYIDLIDTFLEINSIDFDILKKNLSSGKTELLMHEIHQLKGASMTLGADKLAESSARLETMLRNKTEGDATELLSDIRLCYIESVRELIRLRTDLRTQNGS